MARRFDVVIYGATGFTGQLATAHLAQVAPLEGVKWAIAGRTKTKLEKVLVDAKAPIDTPILIADGHDAAALDKICQETTVVIGCAGPFAQFGVPLVDACVRNDTHYCDITGESNFTRLIIEKHHDEATKKGLLIVPQSGFDSVPGDLCNFMVNDYARSNGINVTDVVSFYRSPGGGPSRGTFDTIVEGLKGSNTVPADRSPVSLNPPEFRKKGTVKVPKKWLYPWYDSKAIGWAGVFLMSFTNNKIVRRTNAILGYKSSYDEASQFKGFISCVLNAVILAVFVIAINIPALRKRIQPPQNGGPDLKKDKGFTVTCRGKIAGDKNVVQVKMKSPMSGYPSTAVFVVQIALAIAHDVVRDGKTTGIAGAPKAGVLTPILAVGPLMIPRLARSKILMEGPVKTL